MTTIHIGLDDIDSINGGCTTHFAVQIAWEIKRKGVKFIDYLNLVRLNPSVPWKTRGNGAVAIRIEANNIQLAEVWEMIVSKLEEYAGEFKDAKNQPSVVLHEGEIPYEYAWFANKALHDLIPLDLALRLLNKHSETRYYNIRGKRGVIGALAAIGYTMVNTDYTYELIAYRAREYWGKPRLVDSESIRVMDELYGKDMILNYDYEANRPLITPRGPDPVLLGLRGEDPWVLIEAFNILKISEPVEYMAIFRTNQHTDAHLFEVNSICDIRPYMCVKVSGVVNKKPKRSVGGHVFFELCDGKCCIDVAVYEPTRTFRDIIEELEKGDVVEVMGCVRPPSSLHGLTINLEKIRIVKLAEIYEYFNPKCPLCGSTMESMGKGKGFRCRKCKYRDPHAKKIPVIKERYIKPGIYQPPRSVFKHVMKPIERFGKEKRSFPGILVKDFIVKLI
ncbi:MAG: tRNA(Ile)(2)-agmatinylcytidine synthase [Desulfurococcaceae archaeon]